MSKYIVGIRVEGALNAYSQTKFSFRGITFELEFGTRESGYLNCYLGLEAENNLKAANLANESISEFLDVISFITSCSLAALEIFVILKDEKGSSQRVVFRQISREKTSDIYIREGAEVKAIEEVLNNAASQEGYDLSLRWLRYGYRARTFIEQYSYYWLAFERLLGETKIERTCPHCKEKLEPYSGVDWKNAQTIFSMYEPDVDGDYFKEKILKARHTVFHGGRLNAGFYVVLAEISPKVQKVVESMLVERYKPSTRLDLGTPNQPNRPNNNHAYYSFTTKTPNESFARDYPDDEWVESFSKKSLVRDDENNIELLTFDDYYDKW